MFFCEECRVKRAWPASMLRSMGPCELCKKRASCYDVPSKYLPMPDERKTDDRPGAP